MSIMRTKDAITIKAIRQIAVDADADPRTVERLVQGQSIRGRALRERILDAARLHNVCIRAADGSRRGRAST